jgi:hypothetical protein
MKAPGGRHLEGDGQQQRDGQRRADAGQHADGGAEEAPQQRPAHVGEGKGVTETER